MNFVAVPHLSNTRSAYVLIGAGKWSGEIQRSLQTQNVQCEILPKNTSLEAPTCDHADMSLFHFGGNRVILDRSMSSEILPEILNEFQIEYTEKPLKSDYPQDILLNAAPVGKYLFCNEKYTDSSVKRGYSVINIRQGYAKCSICIVDEHSIITEDPSVASAAEGLGMDVCLIRKAVEIERFDYGFIGGASFRLSPKEMVFTGNLDAHPDRGSIIKFLDRRGMKPIFLTDRPIFDIGGIIPLMQE